MREHLHPNDIGTWMGLIPLAFAAACRHGIDLKELKPDSTGKRETVREGRQSCYGWCRPWSGSITVCIRFREKSGLWLARIPQDIYLDTLAHELAHFVNMTHGDLHARATANILTTIQELRSER